MTQQDKVDLFKFYLSMRYTFIYGNVNFLILFTDLKFAYNLLFIPW